MSWSVYKTGIKSKVREACEIEFDKAATQYEGQEEQKDVLAAKERTLAAIDGLVEDTLSNAVKVEASGSRSGYGVTVKLEVTRIQLLI